MYFQPFSAIRNDVFMLKWRNIMENYQPPPPPWRRWAVKIGRYLVFIYAMFSAVSQLIWCKYALNKSVVEPVGAVVCLSPTPIRDDTVTAIDFQCFHRDTLMLVKTCTKTQKQRDTHRDTSTHKDTHTHKHTQTHIHTHTQTHIYTHTHTYTRSVYVCGKRRFIYWFFFKV